MATDTDVAWAAGLFEGEGSIEVNREPLSRTGVRLHLNTTDLDVLEHFAEVVGCGRVREVTAPSIVKPHWKTCWAWQIARADECSRLLREWLPYLGSRRSARAQEALDLLAEKEAARWRTCHCGRHFSATRGNQWACSDGCRVRWQSELHRMAA